MSFPEIGMLKSQLEAEGIACVTRNESIAIAYGTIPRQECVPELWVLHDEDYARAEELMAEWKDPSNLLTEPWVCPGCGEELEGQFASCWQCGYDREEPIQRG